MAILIKNTKALPINFGMPIPASEGPKAFRIDFDFSIPPASGQYNLNVDAAAYGITTVQTLFIDNSNNSSSTSVRISGSNQLISMPPYSQGFVPLLNSGGQIALVVSTAGTVNVPIQFINVQHDGFMWSAQGNIISGAVTVQGTVTAANQLGAFADKHGQIAIAATAVQIMAANGARKGLMIMNPTDETGEGIAAREPLYINFGAAGGVNDGIAVELQPGGSIILTTGAVPSQAIFANAATAGHKFIAWEM